MLNHYVLLVSLIPIAVIISVIITIVVLKKKYDRRLSDFQDSVLRKQRDEV